MKADSLDSTVRAGSHPPLTSPMTLATGTRTSDRKTSLKCADLLICTNGRISIPGVDMSTNKKVMPLCLGASGSVRTRTKLQSQNCAELFHTFCPLTMNSSPSRSARVASAARSLPAPGSLKSWQKVNSAESSLGRNSRFCSSLPWRSNVGPSMAIVAPANPTPSS